ncbi:MAG TPA: hypothetical protein VLV83_26065 [Acidobacteriota bacterium]|nr:hypothetical protein [Acidobacteriota bacterium]
MTDDNARDLHWTLLHFERTCTVAEVTGNINRCGQVDRLGHHRLYPCPQHIHLNPRLMDIVGKLQEKVKSDDLAACAFTVRFQGGRVAGLEVNRPEKVA